MHLLCFQSFGTNAMGAKKEKRCGISNHTSCNICVMLSGHDNTTSCFDICFATHHFEGNSQLVVFVDIVENACDYNVCITIAPALTSEKLMRVQKPKHPKQSGKNQNHLFLPGFLDQ